MNRSAHELQQAAIALGANLGPRARTLHSAIRALETLGAVEQISSFYETPPLGPPQPAYLNAAVLLSTTLRPEVLLAKLHEIEAMHGRERREKWGPRRLDLDLIALGTIERRESAPLLPHPEAHRRAFVLVPLAEIAPTLILPGHDTVAALLASLPKEAVDAVVRWNGEEPPGD